MAVKFVKKKVSATLYITRKCFLHSKVKLNYSYFSSESTVTKGPSSFYDFFEAMKTLRQLRSFFPFSTTLEPHWETQRVMELQ